MDLKIFTSAISQIAEEKGIPKDKVIEIIEMALAAAYKKDYGKRGQIVHANLDPAKGTVKFWQVKLVVDEGMIYSEEELEELKKKREENNHPAEEEELGEGDAKRMRFNVERHIMLDEAQKIKSGVKAGDELVLTLEAQQDYGRIAAQTAKQVILQRIREAEREVVLAEFKSKEGELLSGIVQRVEGKNVYFDIGRTIGVLPKEEQIMGEFYRPGQRMRLFCLSAQETIKGPLILVSRAYPKFLSKLFELEVPEIATNSVAIKSIAREAGLRSKIAVQSLADGVDPIGSMVGQRGTRVMAVINELGGEKIDIIEYSDKPEEYIAHALSPAKVIEVQIMQKNTALVIVPEDQLSLAIGKAGQNVRLAAKLTGWKIDVRGPGERERGAEEDGAGEEEAEEAEGIKATKEKVTRKREKKAKEQSVGNESGEVSSGEGPLIGSETKENGDEKKA
ncbi:MAG: transcription termination factor NusA [Candidatus Wildermuthbacteria bacterium RIFCSPHIGHO2_02_FULL_47_17]|uniref:Transcription termination/antitermination protein NusA n=2 Tax=Candidatus Wildermuthiibacteriota TaxID=1817923 RepID=A0A1G2R739_9BACT|nr:MAG: transcription termination factor NusA [Candidatus Wildermuthbacteria bacterium RIFCSPHIGHO2_02_FULL_47_17]